MKSKFINTNQADGLFHISSHGLCNTDMYMCLVRRASYCVKVLFFMSSRISKLYVDCHFLLIRTFQID